MNRSVAHPVAAALVLVSLLTLAACSKTTPQGTPPPALPPVGQSASVAAASPPAPATNQHGYIAKTLGQEAGWGESGQPGQNTFTIDKVTVDPKCSQYGTKPTTGHTLSLQVRVATGANPDTAMMLASGFNPAQFQEIGRDGVSRPASGGACTDYTKNLPSTFGVNQKYVGTVELVVPEASGTLVLLAPDLGSGGWEWRY